MVGKITEFEATHPLYIDARRSTSSPTILCLLLQYIRPLNPEDMVELAIKNSKGLFHDICLWCKNTGNQLVTSEHASDDEEIHCIIQKGQPRSKERRMVVVISTASLEAVVSVLEKAAGGCVLGMDVSLFFENSGVRLLQSGYRARCRGVFGGFRTKRVEGALEASGRLRPEDMLELLEELGVNFTYVDHHWRVFV